jgi:thiosulfate/3-mercaptopyruvate sulfurtransferase
MSSLLVTPEQLDRELAGTRKPLVLDLRPVEQYVEGHIPGAVHLDLFGVSSIDTDEAPLRSFFWIIEHLLASRGVSTGVPVVVYDDQSGIRAARAFWFLEYFGHPNVRLLDGGFGAWTKADRATTNRAEKPKAADWTGAREASALATWRDLKDRLGNQDVRVVDTRSDDEYCGRQVRAARGGAVPGAIHLEWTRNLAKDGRFKTLEELRRMYEAVGVTPDKEIVTYCQGGYRAAHTYLALRLLGYPRVRNYIGSWKEWGDRTDLPIEHPKTP